MNLILQIVIPIVVAIALSSFYLLRISRIKAENEVKNRELEQVFRDKLMVSDKALLLQNERLEQLKHQQMATIDELNGFKSRYETLMNTKTQISAENHFLTEKLSEQSKLFEQLQKQAAIEFENLANRILKKNTDDFSAVNHKKIQELILPLKEKIQMFEKKVEDTYEKGLKDQTDLKAELKKLYELNIKISTEANNLTRALKGDVKKQGNWGEIVLERILERSGLTEGQEFDREKVVQGADGRILRPDVVINLPDKKHLIIDSKVSLVAYERFVNAEESADRNKFIKEHLLSLKTHVKELNLKHYSSSPQFNSPDFVLLFIPIESSFSMAIEQDQQLFNFAWENKVVIVSPSTLLATLRTIASIWQQENQTRNAIEIARQSGALYDKFVGFIGDIEKIGKGIDTLQKTYDDASKKLYTGTGNLVRRVEKIRELGASTSKEIPESFKV